MLCLSFFINKKTIGGKIMCRHVLKVPYSSYAPVKGYGSCVFIILQYLTSGVRQSRFYPFYFHSASSLKQESTSRNVALLGHTILILSQPVYPPDP